ncbi:MAG: hypothetical protein LBD64_06310 [Odoribacteraceae bacterium]|nr:hypothetical protein [Odoribacteraceae bacterium]
MSARPVIYLICTCAIASGLLSALAGNLAGGLQLVVAILATLLARHLYARRE